VIDAVYYVMILVSLVCRAGATKYRIWFRKKSSAFWSITST